MEERQDTGEDKERTTSLNAHCVLELEKKVCTSTLFVICKNEMK